MKSFTPEGYPKELLQFGVLFESENDVTSHYLIEVCEGKFKGNALVKVFTTDALDHHFDTDELSNGCEIALPLSDVEKCCEIDLFVKYFFPRFENDMQLYYDEEKYYDGKCKTNSITSLFDCINYAIEYGLNKSGIKPY